MKKYKKASEIKVGVIGYGGAFNMGRAHLSMMRDAGMTPLAVCDPDKARLKVAQDEFPGIEIYESLDAMLKKSDVDLLSVITPHNTHADIAVKALSAGRHVVCEKPLAITTGECDRMISAAKKNGAMISTFHNRHWDGCILQAVKTIKSGAIGDVVRVEAHMGGWRIPGDWWRSSKSISGGILYDWGVHLLEYTLQLVDSEIVEVSGYAKTGFWADKTAWKADTNEDEAYLVVRYASGQWTSLSMSSIDSKPKEGVLEITGTQGTYVFDHGGWTLITHEKDVAVTKKGANPPGEAWRYYKNVADHLTKGTQLIISAEWARRPIHIIDLGCQSAVKGKSIKAKYK